MSDFRNGSGQDPSFNDFSSFASADSLSSDFARNNASSDDWYDQGFDLGNEDAEDTENLEAYGINPNLLHSVEEQVTHAPQNQELSDAQVHLREGSVKIDMDPLAEKRNISSGAPSYTSKAQAVTYGGGSSIYDKDNARLANRTATMDYSNPNLSTSIPVRSVYSDSYLKQKEQEANQTYMGRSSTSYDTKMEDYNDEYGTSSYRSRNKESHISESDNRYIKNRIAQRDKMLDAYTDESGMTEQQRIQAMRKRQIQEQRERFERQRKAKALENQHLKNLKNAQVNKIDPATVVGSSLNSQEKSFNAYQQGRILYPSYKVETSEEDLARKAQEQKSFNPQHAQIWNEAHQALMALGSASRAKHNAQNDGQSQGRQAFKRGFAGFAGAMASIPAGLAIRGGKTNKVQHNSYSPLSSEHKFGTAESAKIIPNAQARPERVLAESLGGPVDETTRSHASRVHSKKVQHNPGPKDNSEKSLEELAKEYPGLSPEHLIKLKRSSNRCHLVSRTPIFDANSNISMYELKFTAGKLFQVNALKSEHVYHVLFGYFIRRGISCFIGRRPNVMVMMPITYDFLDYIDRYSVSRVVLRICPEQPVTPSALHILTKLRRSGMSFAIDLMLLLKKDWNRAILSIEYVMIDLSSKVKEQLHVFQRLKIKAPWLKTIGYNDTNGEGYGYLAKHMIDFFDGPFWMPQLRFNQDPEFFVPMQQEIMVLIHELFKDNPDYEVFLHFLKSHESLSRDMAVFLYRFRHASPRQVQNTNDLFHYLKQSSTSRSFSVLAGRAMLLQYVKSLNISSQYILQEFFKQALIRGYFCEYLNKVMNNSDLEKFGFQTGMFSLLHLFLLKEEVDVIADDSYADIYDRIYSSEVLTDAIECIQAIENTNLTGIFDFIQKYKVPPASVLISHEKAVMRTNELLLVLNIATTRK